MAPYGSTSKKSVPGLPLVSFYDVTGGAYPDVWGIGRNSTPKCRAGTAVLGDDNEGLGLVPSSAAPGNRVQTSVNLWRAGLNYSIHK